MKKRLRPNAWARNGLAVSDDGVGDEIGRHHPGRFVLADPETARDVRQRDVGDRGVEHFHERGERDQRRRSARG